jgi:hypothetical protein
VHRREPVEDAEPKTNGAAPRQRARTSKDFVEREAIDVLKDQAREPAPRRADVENGGDVRVANARRRLRLAKKTGQPRRRTAIGKDLDGDVGPQDLMLGPIDLSHAAGAHPTVDDIAIKDDFAGAEKRRAHQIGGENFTSCEDLPSILVACAVDVCQVIPLGRLSFLDDERENRYRQYRRNCLAAAV